MPYNREKTIQGLQRQYSQFVEYGLLPISAERNAIINPYRGRQNALQYNDLPIYVVAVTSEWEIYFVYKFETDKIKLSQIHKSRTVLEGMELKMFLRGVNPFREKIRDLPTMEVVKICNANRRIIQNKVTDLRAKGFLPKISF